MCFKTPKLCKIQPVYTPDPCVICLQPCLKHTGCNRCKECRICKKCFNQLVKNGNSRCPICNLECEKCKKKETHEECTWSTRKKIIYERVIDINPSPVIAPLSLDAGEREKSRCCKLTYEYYVTIKNTIKCMSHICSFIVLSFLTGLICISSFHNPLSGDLSAEGFFTCVGVGILVLFGVVGICMTPCCCNFNIITCLIDLYRGDD